MEMASNTHHDEEVVVSIRSLTLQVADHEDGNDASVMMTLITSTPHTMDEPQNDNDPITPNDENDSNEDTNNKNITKYRNEDNDHLNSHQTFPTFYQSSVDDRDNDKVVDNVAMKQHLVESSHKSDSSTIASSTMMMMIIPSLTPPTLERHSNILQRVVTPGAYSSDERQQQSPPPPQQQQQQLLELRQQQQQPPSSSLPLHTNVDHPLLRRNKSKNATRSNDDDESSSPGPPQHVEDEMVMNHTIPDPSSYPRDHPRDCHPSEHDLQTLPVLEATLVTTSTRSTRTTTEYNVQDIPAPVALVAHVSDQIIMAEVIPKDNHSITTNNNSNNDPHHHHRNRCGIRNPYVTLFFCLVLFGITIATSVMITSHLQQKEQNENQSPSQYLDCDRDPRNDSTTNSKCANNRYNKSIPTITYHGLIYGGLVTSCQSYQVSPIVIMCGGKSIIDHINISSSLSDINLTYTETRNSNQTNMACTYIGSNAMQCNTTLTTTPTSPSLNITFRTGIIFSCLNQKYIDPYHIAASAMMLPSYAYQCMMNYSMTQYMGLGHYCQLRNQDDTMSWSLSDNIVIENGTKLVQQCESPNATYIGSYHYTSTSAEESKNHNDSNVSYLDYCYQSSKASSGTEKNGSCRNGRNDTIQAMEGCSSHNANTTTTTVTLSGMNSTDAFGKCETISSDNQTITALATLLHDLVMMNDNMTDQNVELMGKYE